LDPSHTYDQLLDTATAVTAAAVDSTTAEFHSITDIAPLFAHVVELVTIAIVAAAARASATANAKLAVAHAAAKAPVESVTFIADLAATARALVSDKAALFVVTTDLAEVQATATAEAPT
jgi:hypothetical protein